MATATNGGAESSPSLDGLTAAQCVSLEHEEFDRTVGELESIVLSDAFSQFQKAFFDEHCHEFDDGEENKLCYMTIFKEYHDKFEAYLEAELSRAISNFSMERFTEQLELHKDDVDVSIFDMLIAMDDFIEFKELMLSHKAAKEGRRSLQLEVTVHSLGIGAS